MKRRYRVKAKDVLSGDVLSQNGRTVSRVERPDSRLARIMVRGHSADYPILRPAGEWLHVLRWTKP